MTELVKPQNTIEILNRYRFTFNKRFGQNFLIDPHVLDRIVAAAALTKDDYVLEIGPGIGTMTQALAAHAKHVFAVEIDDKLLPILADTLSGYDNVTVIHGDILKVDIGQLVEEQCEGRPVKVVANLPYYITTPIVMQLFESGAPVESITVMVQKEVAERMQAGPGSKDYGALSLAVQYYSEPYLVANVPQNCFMPRPDVASAVIRLTKTETPRVSVQDEALLFRVIRASFNQRRKTLFNGLRNAPDLGFSDEAVREAIRTLGKGESVRGEALTLEEFAKVTDALAESRRNGPSRTADGRTESGADA
ncbi:MAG: 16S rRNA (adenine(1518)-N(6)/adenine(1519)-N(6))-dimethyltransferase RsmA [Lachnospiraceae bacterium]|nr:16S rRNA (adenine(1518)-N(6)/adenine(1519)-N(6))-dimethyltransferase RsmA [Lachnospiraceae bacterium]